MIDNHYSIYKIYKYINVTTMGNNHSNSRTATSHQDTFEELYTTLLGMGVFSEKHFRAMCREFLGENFTINYEELFRALVEKDHWVQFCKKLRWSIEQKYSTEEYTLSFEALFDENIQFNKNLFDGRVPVVSLLEIITAIDTAIAKSDSDWVVVTLVKHGVHPMYDKFEVSPMAIC
jgi:hypothetical protein